MKKIIYLTFFSFSLFGFSQTITENFVKTTTFKVATTTTPSPTDAQKVVNVIYFDGLGRSIQQVIQGQSATGKDIITHIEYDTIGRQKKEYLPYSGTSSTMAFDPSGRTSTMNFYANPNKVQETTTVPFSQKLFEKSPLNRVLKQAAPGYDWRLGGGKEIKLDYQTNTLDDEVKRFNVIATWSTQFALYDIPTALTPTNYANFQLYKTITYDENSAANPVEQSGSTVEFKNKEGKVVLKRTYSSVKKTIGNAQQGTTYWEMEKHDTYYIYDQFGNLTFVLPPLVDASATVTQNILDGLCYQYKYDHRNRLVEKKLPSKQWEFIVYDKLDRVVATGPAKSPWGMVNEWGWMITKYDAFSRPVYTGWEQVTVPITPALRTSKQINHNNATLLFETKNTSGSIDGVAVNYSNAVAPTSFKILSVNYYDDYLFPNMPAIPATILGEAVFYNNTQKPRGMPTGSWIRVLDNSSSTSNEMSYTLYDKMARPIRSFIKNHLGGYTQVDSKLDFVGKTVLTETSHKRLASNPEIVFREDFVYSAQDRLLTHTHKINNGATQSITRNEYTELGQLITKNVGNYAGNTTFLQKVDYKYNIRGWLTDINDIANLADLVANDLFSFRINYNKQEANASPLFNGNISTTNWRTANDGVLRKYSYRYDELNRLTSSHYQKPGITTQIPGSYDENLNYDKNGNILSLNRWGYLDNDNGASIEIDKLVYTYNNNQLAEVYDESNSTNGFKDGYLIGADYEYDANGNMIVDKNKGILSIYYNHLNLPTSIGFENEKSISYLYNAVGVKLGKTVDDLVTQVTTNYLSGFQYSSAAPQDPYNGLQFFPHAEGYVDVYKDQFNYVYNYTDHLGNIRLSYGLDKNNVLKIIEENNYYPFGLKHDNYNLQKADYIPIDIVGPIDLNPPVEVKPVAKNSYQIKFQNQERQDELGLNWDSFKWRNYDFAIGRFMGIDPLTEEYNTWSPYTFSGNRVIDARELEGLEPYILFGSENNALKNFGQQYNGRSIKQGVEYGSNVYRTTASNGKVYFYYDNPNKGDEASVSYPSTLLQKGDRVSTIHAHGKYLKKYDNNNFSPADKENAEKRGVDNNIVTPDGSLKNYDVKTNKDTVISTKMPSDPKDPERKNKIPPIENPAPIKTVPLKSEGKEIKVEPVKLVKD